MRTRAERGPPAGPLRCMHFTYMYIHDSVSLVILIPSEARFYSCSAEIVRLQPVFFAYLLKGRSCSSGRTRLHHWPSGWWTQIAIFKRILECPKVCRFAEFATSCLKVRVGFKSSPVFPIISCCFFIPVRDVKHGFLFSGKSTLAILYQFWRTALTLWL